MLDYYKAIEAKSAEMLAAAMQQNWDCVVECEKSCAVLIGELRVQSQEQVLTPDAPQPAPANGVETPVGPPTFPAETVTSDGITPTDPGAEDALTQALRGISGVYQE